MDAAARVRLIELAPLVEKFRSLHPSEQKWLKPLLSRNVQSALLLLESISEQKKSFEEIADETGLNPQTVTQKLNALAEGGVRVDMNDRVAFARTGRPRKLIRK